MKTVPWPSKTRMLFFFFTALLHTLYTLVPIKNSHALFGLSGAANEAMLNYRNIPSMDCILLEGIEKVTNGPFPEEVKTSCNVMIASIIATASGVGIGTAAALIILAGLAATAEGVQPSSQLCTYAAHPSPIPDNEIERLLKLQGKPHSSTDIIDHYDKVCITYNGESEWLKKSECKYLSGIQFCAIAEEWSEDFLCTYITSTCPCVGTIAAGTLRTPVYEKSDNGNIKTDSKGNPNIKNADDFHRYFAKHCNFVTTDIGTKLLPFEYTGIIDEICNSWRGYAKVKFPFTSGPVQCLQSTMQNIFEKQVTFDNVDGVVSLDPKTQARFELITKDKNFVIDTFNIIKLLTSSPSISDNDFQNVLQRISDIKSGSAFLSEFKNDYQYNDTVNQSVSTKDTINVKRSYLNAVLPLMDDMSIKIGLRGDSFLESFRATTPGKNATTTFQNLQSMVKIIAYFAIILYITLIGSQIVLGSIDITLKEITTITLKIATIYYFALGDAWKEYFFRMIFDASIGVSEVLFESLNEASADPSEDCLFTKKYYLEDQNNQCIYPNNQMQNPMAPFEVGTNKKTGAKMYGCLKGPFIFEPSYTRLYNPSTYYEIDTNGLQTEHVLQMYCSNVKDSNNTVPATKIMNDVTNRPKRWTCPNGYQLEEGIRISEYKKLGFEKLAEYFPDKGVSDFIGTALSRINENGLKEDIYPKRAKSISEAKAKMARFKDIEKLETLRSNINQSKRLYPKIEKYGAVRDYAYVGLFDMMDCKLVKYLQYTGDGFQFLNVFDIVSFLFGGVMIIVVLFIMLIYIFFIAALMGRAVQSYLVGIVAITVLVYFTPIIMPLTLFSATKNIGGDWIKKITGYSVYPAILFASIGLSFAILDFNMYGSPALFIEKHMFDSSGNVDGKNCWQDDPWSAPLACLFAKLPYEKKRVSVLFISFTVTDVTSPFFLSLMLTLIKSLIIISMLQKIIEQFESNMKELLEIGVDTSLEGSLFNNNQGLPSAVKSIASNIKSGFMGGFKSGASVPRKKGAGSDINDSFSNANNSRGPTAQDRDSDSVSSRVGPAGEQDKSTETNPDQTTSSKSNEVMRRADQDDILKPSTLSTMETNNSENITTSTQESQDKEDISRQTQTSYLLQNSADKNSSNETNSNKATPESEVTKLTSDIARNNTITENTKNETSKTPTTNNTESKSNANTGNTTLENDNYVSSKGLSGDVIQDLNNRKKSDDSKRTPRKMFNQGADYSNVKSKIGSTNYGFKPQRPGVKRVQHQRADYSNVKSRLFDYEKKGK